MKEDGNRNVFVGLGYDLKNVNEANHEKVFTEIKLKPRGI
jgi:hypothetical protein